MNKKFSIAAVYIPIVVVSCSAPQTDLPSLQRQIESLDSFPMSWLTKQTTVTTIEEQNASTWYGAKIEDFPGAEREKEWAKFKSLAAGEKQIWQWKSPLVGKDGFYCYLSGFCILEHKKVISLYKNSPICQQTK